MKPIKRVAAFFIRSMPIDVRDQFKSWCSSRGLSMTYTIITLMKQAMKNPDILTPDMMDEIRKKGNNRPKLWIDPTQP